MTTTLHQWKTVTAPLRRDIFDTTYGTELATLVEDGDTKAEAEKKRTLARNRAHAEVLQKLYKLAEYEGIRNPVHDDPEWGPNSTTVKAEEKETSEVAELVEWLAEQKWSDFAQSLAAQGKRTGRLSPKQIASAKSMKAKVEVRQAERKAVKIEQADAGDLDLTELPSGYYSVPQGDTRLKVRVARPTKASKWHGHIFVSDGAEYGQRKNYGRQAPGENYRGAITAELRAILEDPRGAQEAYGKLTGQCGRCGRLLEDEDSIARGIGPICAGKW